MAGAKNVQQGRVTAEGVRELMEKEGFEAGESAVKAFLQHYAASPHLGLAYHEY